MTLSNTAAINLINKENIKNIIILGLSVNLNFNNTSCSKSLSPTFCTARKLSSEHYHIHYRCVGSEGLSEV